MMRKSDWHAIGVGVAVNMPVPQLAASQHFAWQVGSKLLSNSLLIDCLPLSGEMDQAAGSWDSEVEDAVSVCHASCVKLGSTAQCWIKSSKFCVILTFDAPSSLLACTTWGWLGPLRVLDRGWLECEMNWAIDGYSYSNPNEKDLQLRCLLLHDATWCYFTWCYLMPDDAWDFRNLQSYETYETCWRVRVHRTSKFNRQMLHGSIKALQTCI